MKRLLQPASLNTDLATLILRLIFGGMFISHGWLKIAMYSDLVQNFDPIGLGSQLSLWLVIFAEFVCGILILLGLFTRYAVVFTFITMLVAYFVAHAKDDFMVKMLPFVYIWLCIVIFILGSGRYSLDAVLFNSNKTKH